MLLHADQRPTSFVGVDGLCRREDFVPKELLCGAGRLLGVITVPPGGEIADHVHNNEYEVYSLLSGTGLYNDNGTPVQLSAGAVTYCPDGETHGIKNNGKEDLVFVAFIGFPV